MTLVPLSDIRLSPLAYSFTVFILLLCSLADSVLRYTDNFVTEGEFSALPPIMQDRVKRTAVTREMGGMMGHYPSVANFPINRIRRIGESARDISSPAFPACSDDLHNLN